VEGRDPHVTGVGADEVDDASAHLIAALLVKVIAMISTSSVTLGQYVRDAPREHPRLARAGARDHEQRTTALHDGFALGCGQSLEE